jgi:PIN domain nuclease of toxin-antitoxin system
LRLLLDTHIVLWQLQGGRVVPDEARRAIEGAIDLVFSVVSFAEIGVKAAIGKLVVPDDLHDHVLATGLRVLGLAPDHGLMVAALPMHHRDPFDRLLIAQALAEELTVVTADRRFAAYGVLTVDAAVT